MRKPIYNYTNPRKLVNIRLQTLNELKSLYPKENTTQKIVNKLIEEINEWRKKT